MMATAPTAPMVPLTPPTHSHPVDALRASLNLLPFLDVLGSAALPDGVCVGAQTLTVASPPPVAKIPEDGGPCTAHTPCLPIVVCDKIGTAGLRTWFLAFTECVRTMLYVWRRT